MSAVWPRGCGVSRVPEHVEDRQSLNVVARRVLLDALVALRDQSDAITIVGAQAIYLRSAEVELSVASYTSDADLGLDPERLIDVPLLEQAMTDAGFARGVADHAGSWLRGERVGGMMTDIAVDLLVPERLSAGGRRSVTIPPHDPMSARRVPGLEAAVVDNDLMQVASLERQVDDRVITARVARPAALLVAKAYKIQQRAGEAGQTRLTDKDAGDVVRLMMIEAGPAEGPRLPNASGCCSPTSALERLSGMDSITSTNCSAHLRRWAPRWQSPRSPVVSTSRPCACWHRATWQPCWGC